MRNKAPAFIQSVANIPLYRIKPELVLPGWAEKLVGILRYGYCGQSMSDFGSWKFHKVVCIVHF